jgi:Protein O-mannosyl-transferase TMEM260-like
MSRHPKQKFKKNTSVNKPTERPSPLPKTGLIVTLALSFIIAFGLYLSTLAPTVTFEDSGELIAAAYNMGIPHEPGYPLFTIAGKVFSMLSLNNVAFCLNLMSAFFAALGTLFLTWAALLMIEEIRESHTDYAHSHIIVLASSLFAGILMATSYENWEQSIITEVYGLNTMFTGLILLLAVAWQRQKENRIRYFLLISYLIGLTLSNHTTSLMFVPILFIYAFLKDRKFILNPKILLSGVGLLFLGLTPYVYLPIASARNPLIDWGNPENWTNFLRTVSRHQYGLGLQQNFDRYMAQLSAYGDLLWQQWLPLFLIIAVIGLVVLYKSQRIYFHLAILLLIFAAPITTFLTDFDVTIPNKMVAAEHKALVSVFYIPSYIVLALLAGVGIYYLVGKLPRFIRSGRYIEYIAAIVMVALPLGFSFSNYKQLDMSEYYFTEDYAESLFATVSDSGMVFADWDPYYFPLNYYQFVEGRRIDILAIDQKLLQRSWYVQWLKDHYPEFIRKSEREVREFLEAVSPFEAGEPYDGNHIQRKYEAMINAFIDRSMEDGKDVYFTYNPPQGIAQKYFHESVVTAFRLRDATDSMTVVDPEELRIDRFINEKVNGDRMSVAIKNNYAGFILVRAQQLEKFGQLADAKIWYTLAKKFFRDNPKVLKQIDAAISKIETQLNNP